ncbi:hypothetical protein LHP98_19170 [Rhodobacter sp. Har01]|uniref:sulfotransferase domain-containing protein n=1 Tax=Rhodobacter sp. Har01 TaxID=2883999 RepID=UPI001D0722E5|nr:sulfotransferase domain-containing protein [Rhodobacter sp. Har01]MCB6180231.1 hypothetical protein [Rhodobacter sp. Har01]
MEFLVHIGFAKAASTYVQKHLFSGAHPDIGILGGTVATATKSGGDIFTNGTGRQRFVQSFAFDADAARARILAGATPDRRVVAISNEELAGHPYSGGIHGEIIAERIRRTLPEAKVLIVIREQRSMLLSVFADFVTRQNARCGLRRFLASRLQTQIPWHRPEFYCFSHIVGWYRQAFGAANVLALPMECIRQDAPGAIAEICRFAGVRTPDSVLAEPENRRDYVQYAALRLLPGLNALGSPTPANGNTGLGIPDIRRGLLAAVSAALPSAAVRRIVDADARLIEIHLRPLVAADNRQLQGMVGHDLARLGYMMD